MRNSRARVSRVTPRFEGGGARYILAPDADDDKAWVVLEHPRWNCPGGWPVAVPLVRMERVRQLTRSLRRRDRPERGLGAGSPRGDGATRCVLQLEAHEEEVRNHAGRATAVAVEGLHDNTRSDGKAVGVEPLGRVAEVARARLEKVDCLRRDAELVRGAEVGTDPTMLEQAKLPSPPSPDRTQSRSVSRLADACGGGDGGAGEAGGEGGSTSPQRRCKSANAELLGSRESPMTP